jgi:hypothetical protein
MSLAGRDSSWYEQLKNQTPAPPERPRAGDLDPAGVADLRMPSARRPESERVDPGFPRLHEPSLHAVPSQPSPRAPATPRRRRGAWRRIAILLLSVAAAGEAVIIVKQLYAPATAAAAGGAGTVTIESTPPGLEIFANGVVKGVTPATFTLAPGHHIVELRGHGVPRVIPMKIAPGAIISHTVEMPAAGSAPTGGGVLHVSSEPEGARVTIDGAARGYTPLAVSGLAPGEHDLVLESDRGVVQRRVRIDPGVAASVVVPMSAAAAAGGPVSGWIAMAAPFALQIFEDGRLIGTTDSERIMMQAGRHTIEVANDTLGYRDRRTIDVRPGKVSTVAIELPRGTVSLNATPWAEVWIDGTRIGETPLGNVAVPIGPHEIVFRHPQLGEKRFATTVTLTKATRVSVDMRTP